MPTIINANTLKAELAEIAIAKRSENGGEDFKYITPGGFGQGTCMYVHTEDNKLVPGCLFGYWLINTHNVPAELFYGLVVDVGNMQKAGLLKEYLVLTPLAVDYANAAQHLQDSGFRGWLTSIDNAWRTEFERDTDDNADSSQYSGANGAGHSGGTVGSTEIGPESTG